LPGSTENHSIALLVPRISASQTTPLDSKLSANEPDEAAATSVRLVL